MKLEELCKGNSNSNCAKCQEKEAKTIWCRSAQGSGATMFRRETWYEVKSGQSIPKKLLNRRVRAILCGTSILTGFITHDGEFVSDEKDGIASDLCGVDINYRYPRSEVMAISPGTEEVTAEEILREIKKATKRSKSK